MNKLTNQFAGESLAETLAFLSFLNSNGSLTKGHWNNIKSVFIKSYFDSRTLLSSVTDEINLLAWVILKYKVLALYFSLLSGWLSNWEMHIIGKVVFFSVIYITLTTHNSRSWPKREQLIEYMTTQLQVLFNCGSVSDEKYRSILILNRKHVWPELNYRFQFNLQCFECLGRTSAT